MRPRFFRRTRLGRLMCRLGLHRMQWASAADTLELEDGTYIRVADYGWCADPDCPTRSTASCYNVEYRRVL